ncbi:MAG: TRAP transporter substrate-binding protein [Saprospiraceae bacterium]|nr:TRAP transporter substrate-binding protein [Saprospiraceae bacterium]
MSSNQSNIEGKVFIMKKMAIKNSLKIIAIFGLFIFAFSSCHNAKQTRTLKLAHSLDMTHSVHLGMEFMAKKVEEKSGGKLKIDIYPSGQLGSERQCLELLQIGSLAMTKVSGAVMENFSPKIEILSLPYIFRDKQHIYKVLDGPIGKQLLAECSQYWLRGLAFFDAGQRSFYTKKPVRTPEDLKNIKLRVQESVTAINLVKALGASPTPISWGELYTALQQGVVDGAENNPPSFYLSRHYEQCKYYTLNEHTAVPDMLIMSTVFWDRLSDDEKRWISEAAQEATIHQRELWNISEQEALAAVEAAGVEIIRPDKSLFAAKTQGLLDAYKSKPELYAIIQKIQETK